MDVPDHPTEVHPRIWVGPHPELVGKGFIFSLWVLAAFQHQTVSPPAGCEVHRCPLTDDAFEIVSGDVARCREAADAVVAFLHRDSAALALITCSAGQNRSSWVAARAMIGLGVSPERAVMTLEAKRAFHNWFFKQDLLKRPH